MKRAKSLFAMILALLVPAVCAADLVVVVSAGNPSPRLTRDEVTNIFLGRYRQMPSGQVAVPVDLPVGDADRARFYRLLVGKEQAEINAYWSRLVFSGKTMPPGQPGGVDEVVRFVATTQGGIAYLDRARVDSRLRIVLEMER